MGADPTSVTGAVTLTGAAVTLADTTATSIAGITATGALTLTSGGAITQSGAIDADSTTSVTAGANAITLTNAGNDFTGAVSLSNSGSNDVGPDGCERVGSGYGWGGSEPDGDHGWSADGQRSGDGCRIGNDRIDWLRRDLGRLHERELRKPGLLGSGGEHHRSERNGSGGLGSDRSATLVASGAVTQSGAIDADSTTSVTAGANAITLTNAGNDFTGAVSLSNSGSNDEALTDANALDLGTVGVGQNLTVTTGGALSDTGVITVAGTTTLDNSGGTDAAIQLDSASTYTGNVTFTTDAGSGATITDNSAFAIQSGLNVNNLSITATGAVTDLGDIDVDGTLTVSASGQTIDLSGGGSNDVTGAVTLTGAAVTLADTTATSIAGITATGALTLTSGGAITQSGAIDADSTTSVTAERTQSL